MRKSRKQVGAMFLAVLMAATTMQTPVSAKSIEKAPTSKSATLQEKLQSSLSKDKDKANYREGEAVVMYYSNATERSIANSKKIFGDDITIEQTYNFTSAQTASATSSKVRSGQALLVSKVSSKTYSTENLIKKLKKQTNVQYAEPNYIYKATTKQNKSKYADYQWGIKNIGQNNGTPGCDINAESAWEQKTGTDKVIAIIDTGVDYTHDDLGSNMWSNPFTDQLKGEHGYDFVNFDDDPLDDNGHGSHCAGIIAGNQTGVSGVNQTAKIMALKFLDEDGSGDLSGAVGAYDYINRAMNLGVDVVSINNSWGGGEGSDILIKLINLVGQKGAITVAAAGNEATNLDADELEPWNFESDYMIKVAASNENDEIANFSNYGAGSVDLAAPGADILSSVCTNVYNPTIHLDDSEYSEIIDTFENQEELKNYKTLGESKDATMEIRTGEGNGFGPSANNSLELSIEGAVPDKAYIAYRPITLPESTSNYHVNAMIKATASYEGLCAVLMGVNKVSELSQLVDNLDFDNIMGFIDAGKDRNYWDMISTETSLTEASKEDEYAVWFAVLPFADIDVTVQLDNIGFSKQNMDPEDLGKYEFYNGTSMAAPQVTGAVALLSEIKGQMEPTELRDMVAGCVRKADACESTTISGGVLDLSKVNDQTPMIKKVTAQKETVTIKGSFFGDETGTVTINGAEAAVKSWDKNQIVAEVGENHNKNVAIEVTRKDEKSSKKMQYLDFNETEIESLGEVDSFGVNLVGTNGSNLYSLSSDGAFHSYRVQTGEWTELAPLSLNVIDQDAVLTDDATFTYDTQLVYGNNGFYTMAKYDVGYYNTKALVYYNMETGEWSKVESLPAELTSVDGSTLASYRNKLYLIGGYDTKEEKVQNTVYSLDYTDESAAFVKEEATIPARFEAQAQVVGDKLVLTLGGDGTIDEDVDDESYVPVPNNIVFDGTNWTEIKDSSFTPSTCIYYDIMEMSGLPYYSAQTGVYNGGIIYTDCYTEELGNVFTYNLKENQYNKLPCSLYSYIQDGNFLYGTTVADKFMFFAGNEYFSYGYDDWSKSIFDDFFGSEDLESSYNYSLNAFDVETGFCQVSGDPFTVDGIGYYYPGSTVQVTPTVENGQYLVSFKVDGQEVKEDSYTIADITGNHNVEVVYGSYVTSISFAETQYTAAVGQSLTLTPVVKQGGEEIVAADLTWSVDNAKYATVENGVVVPLKAGAGKNVTVTAKANDGSNVSASVTVSIKEDKVLATQLTLNKTTIRLRENGSEQLRATINPTTVSNKSLVWESSKSSVAMISSTGEIIARKAGKTTITVRTTDGSNLIARCEVEVLPGNVGKVNAKQTTNSITLSWNKVNGASGYTVYRYDANAKKDIAVCTINSGSKTSVKLTKLNGAKGKALTPGTEYKYRVAAFVKEGNACIYSDKATIKTATSPAATKVTKVKKKSSKKVNVTWKKVKEATGYEVYVSTNKKNGFKKAATLKSANKTNYTQSGLKKGKTYYYKVRTYKKVSGVTIYGDFSNVQKIKMK